MATFDIYASPFGTKQLGRLLQEHLESAEWTHLTAAVAWVKRSGMDHLGPMLAKFEADGGKARFAVGIDSRGSTSEGLAALLAAVGPNGEVWIVHYPSLTVTFHPKCFLFENDKEAVAVVGSGNLTGGGLYTNFELGVELRFGEPDEVAELRREIYGHFAPSPVLQRLTPELLEILVLRGDVITEAQAREGIKESAKTQAGKGHPAIFGRIALPLAPMVVGHAARRAPKSAPRRRAGPQLSPAPSVTAPQARDVRGFVMLLKQTDAGAGQTTQGASRRSPEVFIPLGARNAEPDFWGWRTMFTEDPAREGKFDRADVRVLLGGEIIAVHMWHNPVKHDFRLRNEKLRSRGNVGDILRFERGPVGSAFDYYAEIVPAGTALHPFYDAICSNAAPSSDKRWGYYI